MVSLQELVAYCDERTAQKSVTDFPGAVNGLQFENNGNVTKIGAAVDAGLRVFEEAARRGIDFLIVHHGMFWQAQHPVTGTVYKKFKTCLDANLAVYGSHLPLDAHREIGNNAVLAKHLGLEISEWGLEFNGTAFAAICRGIPRAQLSEKLKKLFPKTFKAIECGSENPERIAILSGSGNAAIPSLKQLRCDTLITGEIKEENFVKAQDENFNLYPCGHYATEASGVSALAAELSEKFSLPWEFVGFENPL
ncbi:MAG: Nif3-like dinuclear metal center hexameric protein [Verrucomicrobia bacterium]|nr:Nif3-like dinuclear metal center hexameric protein [Verrucomicrobiota bacterium]